MTNEFKQIVANAARNASKTVPMALVVAGFAAGLGLSSAMAQVAKPSAADLAGFAGVGPPGVRPDSPNDPKPSPDPHNINGMYHIALGGGAGGPPGGGAPGGGAPGGGAPGGGAPAGGAPGGGAPGGGAPGKGAPGGGGNATLARRFCIPSFVALGGVEGGTEVLQTKDKIVIVSEEMHTIRRIYLNAQHPAVVTPSLNGDSIGHWDGKNLVVDTVGKISAVGAGAATAVPQHMIEHIYKADGGKYLVDEQFNADGTAAAGGGMGSRLQWAPSQDIAEWICEDNSTEYMSKNYK